MWEKDELYYYKGATSFKENNSLRGKVLLLVESGIVYSYYIMYIYWTGRKCLFVFVFDEEPLF